MISLNRTDFVKSLIPACGITDSMFCTAKKKIRSFYGKINGNQLPVHFPFFYGGGGGGGKHFQESGTVR